MKKWLVLVTTFIALNLLFLNQAYGLTPTPNPNAYTVRDPIRFQDFLTLKDGQKVSEIYNTPGKLVNLAVKNLFIVAGILIFGLIILAGLSYIKDSSQGKEEAQKLLTGAVIGFAVMFSAYWIMQIIKVITGADIPI